MTFYEAKIYADELARKLFDFHSLKFYFYFSNNNLIKKNMQTDYDIKLGADGHLWKYNLITKILKYLPYNFILKERIRNSNNSKVHSW